MNIYLLVMYQHVPSMFTSQFSHRLLFYLLQALQQSLDSGKSLPFPDAVLINGQTQTTFSGEQGHP